MELQSNYDFLSERNKQRKTKTKWPHLYVESKQQQHKSHEKDVRFVVIKGVELEKREFEEGGQRHKLPFIK